jgi:hypothetical protein
MATRTTPVGTQTSTDYLSAAEYNGAAGGWIGYVEITSDQSGITTETDIADRTILVTGSIRASNNTASRAAIMYIKESTTYLQRADAHFVAADIGASIERSVRINDPSTGSHTYKLSADALIGGSATVRASSTAPSFLLVQDIGPAA